eukprot:5133296-Amphidinium_carterae.1
MQTCHATQSETVEVHIPVRESPRSVKRALSHMFTSLEVWHCFGESTHILLMIMKMKMMSKMKMVIETEGQIRDR